MIHAESVKQWEAETNYFRAQILRDKVRFEALQAVAFARAAEIDRLRALLADVGIDYEYKHPDSALLPRIRAALTNEQKP